MDVDDVTNICTLFDHVINREPYTYVEKEEDPLQPIYQRIDDLSNMLRQVYESAISIADGNLAYSIDGMDEYSGALKDLQAKLISMLWQINQVCKGDYTQRMDYFGEFSIAFHTMYQALQEKDRIQNKNMLLHEEIAEQEKKLLEMQLQKQIEHYRDREDSYDEIEKYRHDMKNHLLGLNSLLKSEDYEGVKVYLDDLSGQFNHVPCSNRKDNFMLYALLDEKLLIAKNRQVQVQVSIQISRNLAIENKDWCILFGNSLDNALEALQQVEVTQRHLNISIICEHQSLAVCMTNTMNQELEIINGMVETTKRDKRCHGIGLQNIKSCVEKYNGEMKIEVKKGEFRITFILFNI